MEINVLVQVWLSSNTIWDWYCWTRTAPGGFGQVSTNLQKNTGSDFYEEKVNTNLQQIAGSDFYEEKVNTNLQQKITGFDFDVKTCSMGNDVTLMDKWYRKDTNKVREKKE